VKQKTTLFPGNISKLSKILKNYDVEEKDETKQTSSGGKKRKKIV
jgi:hypothetical protein